MAFAALPAQAEFAAVGPTVGTWTWPPAPYAHSADGATWTNPVYPNFHWLQGVAQGNNVWVAVGDSGTAIWSPDGAEWNAVATGATGQFYGVDYGDAGGNAVFAAVGASNAAGTAAVFTSPDGQTWDNWPIAMPSVGSGCYVIICIYWGGGPGQLQDVAYGTPGGMGRFVAVGNTGTVVYSDDSQIWLPVATGITTNLYGVAWGNDRYMAVGYDYINYYSYIYESFDGESWNLVYTGPQYTYYEAVGYGNGVWVAGGGYDLVVSDDLGATWTSVSTGVMWPWWSDVAYGDGRFIVVSPWSQANSTSSSTAVITSTDGFNWQTRPATSQSWYGLYSVAFGGDGQFVGVGYSIVRSAEGLDWVHGNVFAGYYQYAVGSDGERWVAAGMGGAIESSDNGRDWTARYSGYAWSTDFRDVAHGAGTWIAAGTGGKTVVGNDGRHWTPGGSSSANLNGLGFRPGMFVGVGDGGAIRLTEDGSAWGTVTSGVSDSLHGVAWGDGTWVAVGENGVMLASADGITWTQVPAVTPSHLYDIAYDATALGDKWVAVGDGGTVVSSPDGVSWAASATGASTSLRSVTRGDGLWVAVGGSQAFRSGDASPGSWTPSTTPGPMNAVASTQVPALDCLPKVQLVGIGQDAKVWGGGGRFPYTWNAPGADAAGPTMGASTTRTYSALGTYTVTVKDTSSPAQQEATCEVHVVEDPPPPVEPPTGAAPGCGYIVVGGPEYYQWDELNPSKPGSLMGTPIAGLDWSWMAYSLHPDPDFTFNLCGTDYSDFWVASAGHICMDSSPVTTGMVTWGWSLPSWCGNDWATPIPDASWWSPKPAVFGLWGNMNPYYCPGGSGSCMFQEVVGPPGSRVLIVEWDGVTAGWTPGETETFEIKLFEGTNCIEVHYKDTSTPPSTPWYGYAAGYQDGAGSQGYQRFLHDPGTDWKHAEEAWRACPFQAVEDKFTLNEDEGDQVLDVTANDVLAGAFTVEGWTEPSKGTLVPGPGLGEFTYTPDADVVGSDSFTYTVANGPMQSTGTVNIELNPVNDKPSFVADPDPVLTTGASQPVVFPGWATDIRPGPATATDEVGQAVSFVLDSVSNPALFDVPPKLVLDLDGTGSLHLAPSNAGGESTVCFRAVDDGGTAPSTNTWLETVYGEDTGDPVCAEVVQNAPPVAYFEPAAQRLRPTTLTFDTCPRALPLCTHDVDGTILMYLWEFGDGRTSPVEAPLHDFPGPGTYLVRLTVWDDDGAASSYGREVVVVALEGDAPDAEPAPSPPEAHAGEDRAVAEGSAVELAGWQTGGPDDTTFLWTQLGGPDVQLMGRDTPTLAFTAPRLPALEPLDLTFALQAFAGQAASAPDYVTVRVVSANRAPLAVAGDVLVVRPGAEVVLDGSGSLDDDGDTLGYRWEQVPEAGEPPVFPADTDTAKARFVAPGSPTVLHFQLTVTDGKATGQDTVTVLVEPKAQGAVSGGDGPVQPAAKATPVDEARGGPGPFILAAAALLVLAGAVAVVLVRRRA